MIPYYMKLYHTWLTINMSN